MVQLDSHVQYISSFKIEYLEVHLTFICIVNATTYTFEYQGTNKVQGIMIKFPEPDEICLNAESFSNMKNLQLFINSNARISGDINYLPNKLKILDWPGYPLQTLPSNFNPKKLVELNLPHSHLSRLWLGFKVFQILNHIHP